METKKAARNPGSLGGKVRSPVKTRVARRKAKLGSSSKRKKGKRISFQTRSGEIHHSLDDAIRQLESRDMSPESAKAVLEKIKIVQTLLRAATQELENWLKG